MVEKRPTEGLMPTMPLLPAGTRPAQVARERRKPLIKLRTTAALPACMLHAMPVPDLRKLDVSQAERT